jgi:hypothetical protein
MLLFEREGDPAPSRSLEKRDRIFLEEKKIPSFDSQISKGITFGTEFVLASSPSSKKSISKTSKKLS